jgi:hypothetical protein
MNISDIELTQNAIISLLGGDCVLRGIEIIQPADAVMPSDEAIAAEKNRIAEERNWKALRQERNRLIAETDYLALSDSTLSAEMATYRQALRDLPMSTLKVNKIENTATTNGGVQIDVDGHVTIDGQQLPTAGPLSNRNLIINGAMQVAQRATQVTGVTGPGYRTCDRFSLFVINLATWTVQQSTDAPDGFSTSFKVLCTTADASPAASDRCNVSYSLEGYDCQRILNTSTTTHPLQLSFWVKSNRTGNASIGLFQPDNSLRLFTASYNIAAADTWQQVTVPIPVDTAAAFDNDNGAGLAIEWWLNGGSNFEGGTHSAGWVAFNNTARNATNLGVGGAVNDYWQITGVQLEVGSKSTPFEHRSYGDELEKCRRYFQHSFTGAPSTTNTDHTGIIHAGGGNTSSTTGFLGTAMVRFSPNMRTTPTTIAYDLASPRNINKCHRHIYGQPGTNNQSVSMSDINDKGFSVRSDSGVSATGIIFHYTADAEFYWPKLRGFTYKRWCNSPHSICPC